MDHLGTDNLVAAALSAGTVKKFVLVTSLLTNAPNVGPDHTNTPKRSSHRRTNTPKKFVLVTLLLTNPPSLGQATTVFSLAG